MTAAAPRHRWVTLREHVYICRLCGAGKVNSQTRDGRWIVTWHLPTGRSIVASRTPPCEPGPRTDAHLWKYRDELAAARGA